MPNIGGFVVTWGLGRERCSRDQPAGKRQIEFFSRQNLKMSDHVTRLVQLCLLYLWLFLPKYGLFCLKTFRYTLTFMFFVMLMLTWLPFLLNAKVIFTFVFWPVTFLRCGQASLIMFPLFVAIFVKKKWHFLFKKPFDTPSNIVFFVASALSVLVKSRGNAATVNSLNWACSSWATIKLSVENWELMVHLSESVHGSCRLFLPQLFSFKARNLFKNLTLPLAGWVFSQSSSRLWSVFSAISQPS